GRDRDKNKNKKMKKRGAMAPVQRDCAAPPRWRNIEHSRPFRIQYLLMRRFALFFFPCLFTIAALADDAANEARFITNARQLIFEGKRSGEGYFHPDGNRMIFQSEREDGNPFYQMYLLDLLSGETSRVSPGIGKTTCGFFQPGTGRVL